jgi:hypothetical protein
MSVLFWGCNCFNAIQSPDCALVFKCNPTHMQVVEQRRKLPPVLNDKALLTRAAPFGHRADQAYHAPSNRIGVYYSPSSMAAAAQLFEEFPQVQIHVADGGRLSNSSSTVARPHMLQQLS